MDLTIESTRGILPRGGTILGSSRTNPYKRDDGVDRVRQTLSDFNVNGIIAIGGEDTLGVANRLNGDGVNVIGVPKTIDNDLGGTDVTFGFDTALHIATEAIDRLHTTAESHNRILVVEVMGRTAGWIALHSGVAGGADVILIPEIPFDIDEVCRLIRRRHERGRYFSIVVAAEGAMPKDGSMEVAQTGTTDEFGHVRLGGIGYALEREIEARTGFETRATVLGHVQRGGTPTAFDRVLATRLGPVRDRRRARRPVGDDGRAALERRRVDRAGRRGGRGAPGAGRALRAVRRAVRLTSSRIHAPFLSGRVIGLCCAGDRHRNHDGPGQAVRGHDSHALDGRRAEGQLRPPRNADGAGSCGLRPVRAGHAPQPAQPQMARPRPLRALVRPRLDAPVLDAVPGRLRRQPRERHHAVPPARVTSGGAPRVPRPAGHRSHDGAFGAGHLARRGDGAGRADAGRALQPPGARNRRSPHVRDRLRRRPRGGDLRRGELDRRASRPGPADLVLRREPHLDRGRHQDRLHRGRGQALRSLRLACPEPRRGRRA